MKEFLRKHSEFITIPIALIAWYFLPYLLRRVDPAAGQHDLGLLQTFFIAAIGLFIGTGIVWLTLKISVPEVYKTLDDYLLRKEDKLTPWQRGIFSLVFFFGLLLAYSLIVQAFV
jgi:hypothetical protein